MRRRPEKHETPGGQALRRHLQAVGMSVPVWCEEHGIDRIRVQKAMNGQMKRVAVDLAFAIEKASGGAVQMSLWIRNIDFAA